MLLFPITYIFGDVFTEVYGYASSRRAIWLGFFGTTLLYLIGAIVIALPSAPGWRNQQAFATVFGFIPRILAASLIAFWAGEFANSYTMARLKLVTDGRKLWTRTIGSTVVGQAVDTVLVITLTFGGIYPARVLLNIIATGYALKVGYEVIATPLTYLVINWLKRAEHSDAFDRHESFNPFSFAEKRPGTAEQIGHFQPCSVLKFILLFFDTTFSNHASGQAVLSICKLELSTGCHIKH